MTLQNFLKMHQGGCVQDCVSIQQEPYNYDKHKYEKTFFEEAAQEEIINSEIFKEIRNKQVDHFNIIGGGMYKVELCIYLKGE
ncbi:hypothetical protein H0486_18085 [Lachnospiraceae bacterium MD1]|uniref:Uncharacterized protein n=1 Tax=Variimorphobacter saccharofermentans TaxID=2755051 RepID=A0A839K5Z0_9FIRM|nr:hypothetical protein [Variimorphobacter saccharofermentans]MBB2184768.1 hypothetical protein [Variimorphobacter saccharofermentans]